MNQHRSCAQDTPRLQEIHEYERALLERAQHGENIRDEAVLYLQPTIERMAYRLYTRFSPQSPVTKTVERDDLTQEAYARMLAQFPKALTQEKPFRWLLGVAYGAMREQLNGQGDTIKRHPREKPIPLLRLNSPIANGEITLADILPAHFYHPSRLSEHAQAVIEQAVKALPERQRTLIERYFGFYGTPVSLYQICRELHPNRQGKPNSSYLYHRALSALRQTLSKTFPQQAKVAGGGA